MLLLGTPKGKKPLGRPRRRLVDNTEIDLRVKVCDGMDWVDLAQDRTSGGHGNGYGGSIKCWELLE
jgi:hypothetical protein